MQLKVKTGIVAIVGVLLFLISDMFFYYVIYPPEINSGPATYPFRVYSIPLGVLGFFILLICISWLRNLRKNYSTSISTHQT